MSTSVLAPLAGGLLRRLRSVLLGTGIIGLVLGLLMVLWPGITAMTGTVILAAYAISVGVLDIVLAVADRDEGGWVRIGMGIAGALFIVAGAMAVLNLVSSTVFLALFAAIAVGMVWIAEGIFTLLSLGASPSRGWAVLFAVVSIVAGVTLLLSPLAGAATLWLLLGLTMIAVGVVQIVRGLQLSRVLRDLSQPSA